MSAKDYMRAAKGKPFRPADIIVYAAIAALIIVLFTVFVFTRGSGGATEIIAELKGERVFVYSFSSGRLITNTSFSGATEVSEKDGGYQIIIYSDKVKSSYNTVVIGQDGSTYVSDADCSRRKDCVHMNAVTESGGTIICVPHGLKIYSTGYDSPTLG